MGEEEKGYAEMGDLPQRGQAIHKWLLRYGANHMKKYLKDHLNEHHKVSFHLQPGNTGYEWRVENQVGAILRFQLDTQTFLLSVMTDKDLKHALFSDRKDKWWFVAAEPAIFHHPPHSTGVPLEEALQLWKHNNSEIKSDLGLIRSAGTYLNYKRNKWQPRLRKTLETIDMIHDAAISCWSCCLVLNKKPLDENNVHDPRHRDYVRGGLKARISSASDDEDWN